MALLGFMVFPPQQLWSGRLIINDCVFASGNTKFDLFCDKYKPGHFALRWFMGVAQRAAAMRFMEALQPCFTGNDHKVGH